MVGEGRDWDKLICDCYRPWLDLIPYLYCTFLAYSRVSSKNFSLAKVFCAQMKEHLKTTLNVLNPVAGTNLLAAEDGLNRKVFWCLFVVQFFVFLDNATKENA